MLVRCSVRQLAVVLAGTVLVILGGSLGWVRVSGPDAPRVGEAVVGALGAWLVLVLPLCVALVRKVRTPMSVLKGNVARVLDGEYAVDFSREGTDEMAEMLEAVQTLFVRLRHDLGFARGVLKGIDAPFVVVDTKEVLVYTNVSLLEILQHDGVPEDFYGQNVAHFFYGDASRRTVLRDSLENHTVTAKEVELVGRRGDKRTVFIHASPLFDLSGQLMGALCIYQDRTELRAREAEILSKNAAISQAIRESEAVCSRVDELAHELAAQVSHTSQDSERQMERAISTATAMEQMNAAVYEVAKNASSAAGEASAAREKAREGADVVEEAVRAIEDVARQSAALRASMEELGTQVGDIGQIMNVITDIADQTNLLALNAAIEAARAGDAGRGFAVVADEVRKLAEKTMRATQEVGGSIQAIQEGARHNAASVDSAVQAVERSRGLSAASGEALLRIVQLVNETTDQVQAIATAAEEQSTASDHINQAVDEVKDISRQSATQLQAVTVGIKNLARLSEDLKEIIAGIDN